MSGCSALAVVAFIVVELFSVTLKRCKNAVL